MIPAKWTFKEITVLTAEAHTHFTLGTNIKVNNVLPLVMYIQVIIYVLWHKIFRLCDLNLVFYTIFCNFFSAGLLRCEKVGQLG